MVFEHLKHYCSLLDTLPAITVLVEQSGAVVTRGHKYLRIARELDLPRIRAVISPSSDERAVSELIAHHEVETLSWDEIDQQESRNPVPENWHVFYFERPLTSDEKLQFDRQVAGFFEGLARAVSADTGHALVGEVHHNDAESCAEFLARTPVADESWFGDYLAAVSRFSREVAPVVSYQGRRFGGAAY